MNLVTAAYGQQYNSKRDSDIIEVFATVTGLRIIVSTSKEMFNTIYLEVFFPSFRAYRFLDEGDLLAYWEHHKDFQSSHHVYKIIQGGWITGEPLVSGTMTISMAVESYREWFIATSNGCITVLSMEEPVIREAGPA